LCNTFGSGKPLQELGMRCPFLKDAVVRYCSVSGFKKMIAQVPGHEGEEKCSGASYADCSVARQHGIAIATEPRCPFLQESQAQYCSAAAVTKFIPYSGVSISRCGGEDHRVCELYVAHQTGEKGRS